MKVKSESEVAQSCPTLSDPMDCSLPGSSVHGIFQAKVLEWDAIAFSEETSEAHKKETVSMKRRFEHRPVRSVMRVELLGPTRNVLEPEARGTQKVFWGAPGLNWL